MSINQIYLFIYIFYLLIQAATTLNIFGTIFTAYNFYIKLSNKILVF